MFAQDPHTEGRPWALVTGAAKRIGRALSLYLAKQGYNIIIHYHHAECSALDLASEVRALGGDTILTALDISASEGIADWCQDLLQRTGKIDLLINNASVFEDHDITHLVLSDLYRDMNIHAVSPLLLAQQLYLHEQPVRHIVNMLDANIHKICTHYVSYYLSKQMLHHITLILARSLAPLTRVNAICPGPVLPPPGQNIAYLAQKVANMPLNQRDKDGWEQGGLEQICSAVGYLDRAHQTTGQVLMVDRGQHLL